MKMWIKWMTIVIPLLGTIQIISGSKPAPDRPTVASKRPIKFSSQIPSSANRRQSVMGGSDESFQPQYDYSGGFPEGFAHGLPSFDFNGPIPASSQKEQANAASDNENFGFVHGPPKGFPNLDSLGADFPNFEGNSGERRYHNPYSNPPPSQEGSAPISFENDEREEEYLPRPGPNSIHRLESGYRGGLHGGEGAVQLPLASPSVHPRFQAYQQQPYQPFHQQQSHAYSPRPYLEEGKVSRPLATSSSHYNRGGLQNHASQRNSLGGYHSVHPQIASAKRPIVLKEAGQFSGFGVGPSFLPSNSNHHYRYNRYRRSTSGEEEQVSEVNSPLAQPEKKVVLTKAKSKASELAVAKAKLVKQGAKSEQVQEQQKSSETKEGVDDLKADGSEQQSFWELSSPFILFDRYKKEAEDDDNSAHAHSTPNVTYQDTEEGEQRFFPSFPASAPYLGGLGNPFGGGPAGRPPLFPGPAVNRAPSRYHPQFGPKYTAPAPNRGPSNVYSAESHDRYQDTNLLGSGNFEVVRGGTYYGDDDDGYHGGNSYHHPHDDDDGYYHHNGHSSPQGYRAPGGDFFSNFRDFADINPPSRSFSHNHETLSESRQLSSASNRQPKNILDKLQSSSDSVPVHHALSRESDPMMATF